MAEDSAKVEKEVFRKRLMLGAVIFVAGQLAPLLIPFVVNSALPATWKTTLSGLLLLGVPELAILASVVVLGKAGFNELKSWLFGLFKRTFIPSKVSRRRYYVGLILLLIPVLLGWTSPYLFQVVPDLTRYRLIIAISGDVLLVMGLYLMGGQFWDKLRALFVYDAEVTFSSTSESSK